MYVEIQLLSKHGLSLRRIAAEVGCAVNTVRRQLAPKGTHVLEVVPPTVDTPMNANLTVKKISATEVAAVTLRALERRRPLALPGTTKLMPLLLRIAPDTIKRMVAAM